MERLVNAFFNGMIGQLGIVLLKSFWFHVKTGTDLRKTALLSDVQLLFFVLLGQWALPKPCFWLLDEGLKFRGFVWNTGLVAVGMCMLHCWVVFTVPGKLSCIVIIIYVHFRFFLFAVVFPDTIPVFEMISIVLVENIEIVKPAIQSLLQESLHCHLQQRSVLFIMECFWLGQVRYGVGICDLMIGIAL